MEILIKRPVADEAASHALGFVDDLKASRIKWTDRHDYNQSPEWPADGYVYFAVIGYPYISHVKVGFTTKDPVSRVRSLQTGCPFPIRLLGYVFGSVNREQELHRVFSEWRLAGEWFEYSGYVAQVIECELSEVPL